MKILAVTLFVFFSFTLKAQLDIDTTLSEKELVYKVLMSESSDMLIRNIQYRGSDFSIASFVNESPEVLIDKGLILSTGDVFDAMGPNKKPNTGVRASGMRDQDLQSIATSIVIDATVLEFEVLVLRDSLSFEYVFASEEYPEYVNQGVNDVFGFFVKEINSRALSPHNIALLDDGRTTVSIDNVNHRVNEKYFLKSDFFEGKSLQFWEQNRDMMMRSRVFEFDGFTVPLEAKVYLKPGKWYQFKIAISDVGDRYFDSAVMIKAQSFKSKGNRIPQADEVVKSFVKSELKDEKLDLAIRNGQLSFDLQIQFNSNESVILKQSFKVLSELVDLMQRFPSLKVLVIGHTDNVGSESDNLKLSENRALAVKAFLSKNGINKERLSVAYKGESEPKASNDTDIGMRENRRVEFVLTY